MAKKKNHGKEFEDQIRKGLQAVEDSWVERLPDQVSRFKGSNNPSDFIFYKYPRMFYLECKSTEEDTLSFEKITQWQDLLERARVNGIVAGVMVWFINRDETYFIDIRLLECMRQEGYKSIPWDCHWVIDKRIEGWTDYWTTIRGVKKRVYFDYDMNLFMQDIEYIYGGND